MLIRVTRVDRSSRLGLTKQTIHDITRINTNKSTILDQSFISLLGAVKRHSEDSDTIFHARQTEVRRTFMSEPFKGSGVKTSCHSILKPARCVA